MIRWAAVAIVLATCAVVTVADVGPPPSVSFSVGRDQVDIRVGGRPFATYVLRDRKIRRPFFADVFAPDGTRVTRNHPPIAGKDAVDHADMHPGIWLAFGELGGADFWRNKASVEHVDVLEVEAGASGGRGAGANARPGKFAVLNRYRDGGRTVCEETCRIAVIPATPEAVLLVIDSEFRGEHPFAFGDQEEMGLGVRLASELTKKAGGQIHNADGLKDEKHVWGKTSDWCSYSNVVGGKRVGAAIFPDPANFRRSWFHARDYGLILANPFGQKAFTKGPESEIVVKPGETLRLRFGVLIYSSGDPAGPDLAQAYKDFIERLKTLERQ